MGLRKIWIPAESLMLYCYSWDQYNEGQRNQKKKSWQVWDFWYEDNMVMRLSYLNDGTSYTGKMIFNILKLP